MKKLKSRIEGLVKIQAHEDALVQLQELTEDYALNYSSNYKEDLTPLQQKLNTLLEDAKTLDVTTRSGLATEKEVEGERLQLGKSILNQFHYIDQKHPDLIRYLKKLETSEEVSLSEAGLNPTQTIPANREIPKEKTYKRTRKPGEYVNDFVPEEDERDYTGLHNISTGWSIFLYVICVLFPIIGLPIGAYIKFSSRYDEPTKEKGGIMMAIAGVVLLLRIGLAVLVGF